MPCPDHTAPVYGCPYCGHVFVPRPASGPARGVSIESEAIGAQKDGPQPSPEYSLLPRSGVEIPMPTMKPPRTALESFGLSATADCPECGAGNVSVAMPAGYSAKCTAHCPCGHTFEFTCGDPPKPLHPLLPLALAMASDSPPPEPPPPHPRHQRISGASPDQITAAPCDGCGAGMQWDAQYLSGIGCCCGRCSRRLCRQCVAQAHAEMEARVETS